MTASFTITFPHDGDICYLAYHYPYTYSRLKTNLEKLATKNSRKDNNIYLKIDQLTESLGEFFFLKSILVFFLNVYKLYMYNEYSLKICRSLCLMKLSYIKLQKLSHILI